jgi:hypothetical protein
MLGQVQGLAETQETDRMGRAAGKDLAEHGLLLQRRQGRLAQRRDKAGVQRLQLLQVPLEL